jgi:uncharacterized protein YbaR (Trm112 family)
MGLNETIKRNTENEHVTYNFIVDLTLSAFIDDDYGVKIARSNPHSEYLYYRDVLNRNYDNIMEREREYYSLLHKTQLPEMPLELIQVIVPLGFNDDTHQGTEMFVLKCEEDNLIYVIDHDVIPVYMPAELFAYNKEGDYQYISIERYGIWKEKDGDFYFEPKNLNDFYSDQWDYKSYLNNDHIRVPSYKGCELSRVTFNLSLKLNNMDYGYGPFENALRRKCEGTYEDYHMEYGILTVDKIKKK